MTGPESGLPGRHVESRTLDEYQQLLLGGRPTLTADQLAEKSGIPIDEVHNYLLEMGFSHVEHDEVRFTERDLDILVRWTEAAEAAGLAPNTTASLARAQSHLSDRLALWEIEALFEGV